MFRACFQRRPIGGTNGEYVHARKELQRKVLQHGLVVVQCLQHHVDGARRPPETGPVKEPDESQTLLGPLPNQLLGRHSEAMFRRTSINFPQKQEEFT